eukprot:TRINITY_DN7633_c0_g1_i2.p1 TRINITY_DN7633_c0_g1~~TRINITY_DN7633_c0_g1_i2.p1  ORF type:complete len:398 (-),score=28.04 TRINITY_DN7633_c0_g1_i2:65-1258(-)
MWAVVLFCSFCWGVLGLDNGLGLRPPMGWMDWERFRCNVDCKNDPDNCIGEKLFRDMADRLVADGYSAVGYKYVDIDDCWLSKERDSQGRLTPNPLAFPSGMKALSDYIHSKGLLFGMYEDIGSETCGGFPGSEGHFLEDAQTFASWGVDALKLDGCYYNPTDYQAGYTNYSSALNATGRPILFSCSWPAYVDDPTKALYYPYMARICNIWRNWDDIEDTYASVASIANYWGDHSEVLMAIAQPGAFHDADQLIIGNSGLSEAESQTQMAIWAVIASPLLMSNDLRKMPDWARRILLNKEVIAVNQDALGRQGGRVLGGAGGVQVWRRGPLVDSTYAVVIWNDGPAPAGADLDLRFASGRAHLRDLFAGADLGIFNNTFPVRSLSSHGSLMLKVTPV